MSNYNLKKTADGSFSLYSNEFNELMHTRDGAYEESIQKHILPSNILNLDKKIINVLDIGFGAGYNILALLYETQKLNKYLNIVSLEKNKLALSVLKQIKLTDNRDRFYQNVVKSLNKGIFYDNRYKIKVVFGDARFSLLKLLKDKMIFDVVFHDPFSPGKNPELWSVQYFKILNKLVTDKAIITTYSAAPQIRSAMYIAGFKVFKAKSTGKKKEGTLASKSIIDGKMEIDYLELQRNKKSEPYNDENFSLNRNEILNYRLNKKNGL